MKMHEKYVLFFFFFTVLTGMENFGATSFLLHI